MVIRIKKSLSTDKPDYLYPGELAYSKFSGKLFIGDPVGNGELITIGGDSFVNRLNNLKINDISDVQTTTPYDGQYLEYDSVLGKWTNKNHPSAKQLFYSNNLYSFCDVAGAVLTTGTLTTNRLYFYPFSFDFDLTIFKLGISVTTAATGTCRFGLYSNYVYSGRDSPNTLIVSSSGSTSATGNVINSISPVVLKRGEKYWVAITCNAAPGVRCLNVASVYPYFGRVSGSTAIVSYYYATGSGTLPSTAPTTLTVSTGSLPVVYFTMV